MNTKPKFTVICQFRQSEQPETPNSNHSTNVKERVAEIYNFKLICKYWISCYSFIL